MLDAAALVVACAQAEPAIPPKEPGGLHIATDFKELALGYETVRVLYICTLPHADPPCSTQPHRIPPWSRDPTLPHHRRHSRLCTRLHHAGAHAPDLLEQGAQGVG